MEAAAHLRFAKISVRKVRTVLDMVRGRNVATALDQLRFTRKAAAPMVGKLVESAIANAQQHDESVKLDRLYVKRAWADKASGKLMVRWRPRAQGRATKVNMLLLTEKLRRPIHGIHRELRPASDTRPVTRVRRHGKRSAHQEL